MCHWLCVLGLFFSGTCIEQGFDMKLLQKRLLCQISLEFIQSRWDYFCIFFSWWLCQVSLLFIYMKLLFNSLHTACDFLKYNINKHLWIYQEHFLRKCIEMHLLLGILSQWPHVTLNTLRPRQNGRHFADDILKHIFLNEIIWIPIKISLKFVPKGSINKIPALVQIMAWRRPGDKPLSEPMVVNLPTHICVTRPQWVKMIYLFWK